MISRRCMSLWMSCMVSGLCACSGSLMAAQPDDIVPRELGESTPKDVEPAPQEPDPAQTSARTAILSATQQAHAQADTLATSQTIIRAHDALTLAQVASVQRMGAFEVSLQSVPDYTTILEAWKSPTGALSVGTTSRGSLLGSVELPMEGPHHIIIARARPRKTRYGHPTMIDVITHTAAHVDAEFPGSKLAMGNIAYKKGGDIRWSVSHNSGRDADIAFYVRDAMSGKALDAAPDLITFDDEGHSTDYKGYEFDVPRNWSMVKGLLTHSAQIQYVFVSEGLKAKLLAHAQLIEEPAELITKASEALRQPAESLPHNDHFHLRLACDLADRVRGCVDNGPRWAWGNWHEDELTAYTHAMIPALNDPDPAVRLLALDYIAAIGSPVGAEFALGVAAYNDMEDVRKKALKVGTSFYTLTGSAHVTAQNLIRHPDTDLSARAKLYAMLRRSRDIWTVDFALAQLADDTIVPKEQAWAARSLAHHMKPELVPILLEQLRTSTSTKVREELAVVLRRITNRSEQIDWSRARDEDVTQGIANWERWWEAHAQMPREAWLRQGFVEQLSLEPETVFTATSIDPMIQALPDAPDHLTYNINRSLREFTGKWSSLEQRNNAKLHKMWSKWWKKNRGRFMDRA